VTTALELIASSWPDQSTVPVLVEADMGGGVLAARHVISVSPGMASLAESLRRSASPLLLDHAQRLPSGVAAVTLTPSVTAASAQLRAAGAALGPFLKAANQPVFVDLGTVTPGAPTERLMDDADLFLWFVRPVREEVTLLFRRLQETAGAGHNAAIVVVGQEPYSASQIEESLELRVLHTLPLDRKGAKAYQVGGQNRALANSKLVRSCRSLAMSLNERFPRSASSTPPAPQIAVSEGLER